MNASNVDHLLLVLPKVESFLNAGATAKAGKLLETVDVAAMLDPEWIAMGQALRHDSQALRGVAAATAADDALSHVRQAAAELERFRSGLPTTFPAPNPPIPGFARARFEARATSGGSAQHDAEVARAREELIETWREVRGEWAERGEQIVGGVAAKAARFMRRFG